MSSAHQNAHLLHTPVHGSWLYQIEIYLSLVHRHVLTPTDFADLKEVSQRLSDFENLIDQKPPPFNWE